MHKGTYMPAQLLKNTPIIDLTYTYPFPNIQLNETLAQSYLTTLFQNTNKYVFTTFADPIELRLKPTHNLTSQKIGTFAEHKNHLLDMNRRGAGIFVTINETDLTGRKLANITSVNCVYIEVDRDNSKVQAKLKKAQITPSMVVESSPGKFHYYFLTEQPNIEFDEAKGMLQTLVDEYHGDMNAKDIARVLRIPGFAHVKKTQWNVDIRANTGERFTWEYLLKTFPPTARNKRVDPTNVRNQLLKHVPDTLENILLLSYIPPDQDRTTWLSVLMALHHEYRGSDEGLKLAREWSKGAYQQDTKVPSNYLCEKDIDTCWYSFDFNTNSSNQVTLGSIVYKAKANGYMSKYELPPEKFELAIANIPGENLDTLKKISQQYAITALPTGGSKIVRRNSEHGSYIYSSLQDLNLQLGNLTVLTVTNKGKTNQALKDSPAVPIWIASNATPRYDNIIFKPIANKYASTDLLSIPENAIYGTDQASSVINKFYGFKIRPKVYTTTSSSVQASKDPVLINTILDLVYTVIADGNAEVTEYIHKWIASTRQKPDQKLGVMLTLMGLKGTGKSVMSDIIQALHYPYCYHTASFTDIVGNFNDHLETTTLLALEEATWGGDTKQNSILKDLITSDSLTIKKKFEAQNSHGSNYLNIIATANPGYSVPEESRDKERRFFTVSVSSVHRKDRTYFSKFGTIKSKQRANLVSRYAAYLDDIDLTGFDPHKIPSVVGKHSQHNQWESAGAVTKFLRTCIEDERIIVPHNESNALELTDTYNMAVNEMWNDLTPVTKQTPQFVYIKATALKASFLNYCRNSVSHKVDSINITKEMMDALPTKLFSRRNTVPAPITNLYPEAILGSNVIKIANRKTLIHFFEEQLMFKPGEYI